VKIIRSWDDEIREIARKEYLLLNSLDHQNIIKIVDYYENS
jgi:hypothetical protein